VGGRLAMAKVTSPGHKLGQLIGNFFERFFSSRLMDLAEELGLYCDQKGLRPEVRGRKKKVTWVDNRGNAHELDYVFERSGSRDRKGVPVAFIELAWRRYTKHSRNKAGEIEAALVPLKETYSDSCNFLGAILGGEFTEGALKQLTSKDINILYIPYRKVVDAFLIKGIDLDYPENAADDQKRALVEAWRNLSPSDMRCIEQEFAESISSDYSKFAESMKKALLRKIERIRILPLFGSEMLFTSVKDAIAVVEKYDIAHARAEKFCKFEIYIKFTNGDRIECSFQEREKTIEFLEMYRD
jgi:hypothetical protein